MTGSLRGEKKGNQKWGGKLYPVTCTDTANIPDLSVNIFSMTRALTKRFNMTLEKESLVLKKNATILKFEDRLDHGNSDSYQLEMRLYTIPKDAGKMDKELKKPEGKTAVKLEGMARLQPPQQ